MIDSCLDRYLNIFSCQIPVSIYSCMTINFICALFVVTCIVICLLLFDWSVL